MAREMGGVLRTLPGNPDSPSKIMKNPVGPDIQG
jgi:hypothetical protein